MRLHFTSTYSSWLNQVELWFGRIECDVIARGGFRLGRRSEEKARAYIRHYNKAPRAVKWKYSDTSKRLGTHSAVTGHQPRRQTGGAPKRIIRTNRDRAVVGSDYLRNAASYLHHTRERPSRRASAIPAAPMPVAMAAPGLTSR